MGYKIEGKINGVAEVLSVLDGLSRKLNRKLGRAAVSAAASRVSKRAKQLARVDTNLLKKSIGTKVKMYKGAAVAVIGPRKGFRQEVTRKSGNVQIADPVKYAHLVELGTKLAPAYPFLKPAIEGQQAELRQAMADSIAKGLQRAKDKGDA